MLQKSGRLVLWEAMFILELHSAETQEQSGGFLGEQACLFSAHMVTSPYRTAYLPECKHSQNAVCMALNSYA